MPSYQAPIRDMRFVLYELNGGNEITKLPGLEEMTPDIIDPTLEAAAQFCEEVIHPLNRSGDEEGCTFENGVVYTPKGFKDAYRRFCEGGWTSFGCDPVYGGQDVPRSVGVLIQEMMSAANTSFSMYPGLSKGAYHAIHLHGSDELKNTYLPKLVDGTWTGTMCLTEPQCGTDLGLVRTKAVPADDGSYRITGTKIFISAGEHDLAENIIHLVLARLPDAQKGVKGISLFLVPKFLVKDGGTLGPRNGVACGSIEHKMGIKASSTCVLNFDDAKGFLVGEPHKGLRAMFTMMNDARMAVGIQGLGLADAAHQGAATYARDRLQGRALSGTKYPDKPADPLTVHPDVRRMLLTMRASVEGCRALGGWVARELDLADRSPDPAIRQTADDFVALLTPVVKSLFTDLGSETSNLGVQIFGGHGYIREHGMEQLVRDARITQIYEGANGIQALDLVGRKLPANYGRLLRSFFHPVSAFIEAKGKDPKLAAYVQPLAKAFARLQQATAFIAQKGLTKPDEAGAAASDYLRLFGLVALAYMWARIAEIALAKAGTAADSDHFYQAKLATGLFFAERILPQTGALLSAILAGGKTMMEFPDEAF
ncbi:MAG: acyl-CoA dehydrogenase C-terminal domain-containing protein [Beijerinckiaceae bacterium]